MILVIITIVDGQNSIWKVLNYDLVITNFRNLFPIVSESDKNFKFEDLAFQMVFFARCLLNRLLVANMIRRATGEPENGKEGKKLENLAHHRFLSVLYLKAI